MVFSSMWATAIRLFSFIPKQWLIAGALGLFVFYAGVNYGRAPYKEAAAISGATSKLVEKTFDKQETQAHKQGKKANEAIKDFECIITSDVADWLSINSSD